MKVIIACFCIFLAVLITNVFGLDNEELGYMLLGGFMALIVALSLSARAGDLKR